MNDNADAPDDANPSGAVPVDRTVPAQSPRDADVDQSTSSSDAPHIVYHPLPASRADTARQQRALRRVTRLRKAPSWLKKVPWILFPVYGLMRLHDENYEEHYEQWQERERRDYDER